MIHIIVWKRLLFPEYLAPTRFFRTRFSGRLPSIFRRDGRHCWQFLFRAGPTCNSKTVLLCRLPVIKSTDSDWTPNLSDDDTRHCGCCGFRDSLSISRLSVWSLWWICAANVWGLWGTKALDGNHNQPPGFVHFALLIFSKVAFSASEWYFNTTRNDLLYWGLDYPPLTAYHSWILGQM